MQLKGVGTLRRVAASLLEHSGEWLASDHASGLAAAPASRLVAAQRQQLGVMRALATFGGAPLASRALLALLPAEPSARYLPSEPSPSAPEAATGAEAADEQVALAAGAAAADLLRLALNRSGSTSHDALLAQGHALTLAGDHTSALASFRELTRAAPEWAEGHARVSAAQAALGKHAACAAAAFTMGNQTCVQVQPGDQRQIGRAHV